MKNMSKTSSKSERWARARQASRPPERPLLLTATRAAERLGVSRNTFYVWLRSGYLGAIGVRQVRVAGRGRGDRRMFAADSIERAIARLATEAASGMEGDGE